MTPAQWVPERSDLPPLMLDGTWQVLRWPFPAGEAKLAGPQPGDVSWQDVRQPGKVFYDNPEQPPSSIAHWNRVTLAHLNPEDGAIIRRRVSIPAAWKGKRILLRFEGIYPAGRIYWDGKVVGEQWSGLTRTEVDVTDWAAPGTQHVVAVRLYRRHRSVQLDMPRHSLQFAGLNRSAFLHAVEAVHVSDFHLKPELAGDFEAGSLRGFVSVCNSTQLEASSQLRVRLEDSDGRRVADREYLVSVPAGQERQFALDVPAGSVRPWNAECPHLYQVHLELVSPQQPPQRITRRIGFRRFTVDGGRPCLNGKPVKFRGVNHLTFHPEGGMYTPAAWLRDCLMMMKRANVNAIRTHFYGPPELADLCDELGIYLVQELPIDWGQEYVHDPVHLGPMLHRMAAGVRRDRDHASVMVWAIGNENMPLKEASYDAFMRHLRLCNAMVKRVDPTRPTVFPPPGPAGQIEGIFEARLGDIGDIHYSFQPFRKLQETGKVTAPRTWEPSFETLTREQLRAKGWSGVWFSSEYGINNMLPDLLNSPYTSILADVMEDPLSAKNCQQVFIDRLRREWGYLRDEPSCLGGAYFCWIAAGSGTPWGWIRWGEDADYGIVTAQLQPKPAFWAMRTIFSPVRFPERIGWKPGQKELSIQVHNDYHSLDLRQCTLRNQMAAGPPWMGMLGDWRDVPMSGPPGTTASVTIPIWNPETLQTLEAGKPIVCRCSVIEPSGYRPITADILVIPAVAGPPAAPASPASQKPEKVPTAAPQTPPFQATETSASGELKKGLSCKATRLAKPPRIDAKWDKPPWQDVTPERIGNSMGRKPGHRPDTQVKIAYDDDALYLIFRVDDRYVRAAASKYQDSVCADSCVEFFFSPGRDVSHGYFNLETNCGGVTLFQFQRAPGRGVVEIPESEYRKILIAHSLPAKVDPEIETPVAWTVEYRLPIEILKKYCQVTVPASGVAWRANFYKCGDKTSHPHWLTWSPVDYPTPCFHVPESFGLLKFE